MSILNKKFISLFILSAINLLSQSISEINFHGAKNFNESELVQWSGVLGSGYFPAVDDTIKSRVFTQMGLIGYLHPSVDSVTTVFSTDSSKVSLHFYISEGSPTYISSINLNGDSVLTKDIISSFKYLEGSIFSKAVLEENISRILTHLENNGYPFAKVITSAFVYTDSLSSEHYTDITLKINKEVEGKIDKVEIEGNTTTKDFVIVRELRLSPGELYSQREINELPARLNRLRFFEPVVLPDYYINSAEEGVLLINIKEKQTNNFDGIIGYIPARDENEKGYLTGLVNVSLRNLFGTGRAAAIRWQQLNRNSQELELRYLEPWLFSYPFNVEGSLFQRKQDTSYVQRNIRGSVEYLATEDISAAVFISTEEVIPTEKENIFFTVYNSTSLTTGVNLKIDTRDDPYSPTGGVYFINSYAFSRKKISGPIQFLTADQQTNINLQRIALDIAGFYELFSRQVITLGLHGRELRGSFFEVSDLYRLGGTNTLRGYREEQFQGSRIFWSNFEYRYLLTRRSFAFLFLDSGYFLYSADPSRNILKQEDFLIGYGLGLNIETGLGVLGVSFALAEGDSFSEGKIHFGLINEF